MSGAELLAVQKENVDIDQFYKNAACPFASWFKSVSNRIPLWEENGVDKYEKSWKEGGSPDGFEYNDHNYNTLLGQGNTLGFIAGTMRVFNDIPTALRKGIFASGKTLPAILRFSDFGADDASLVLARAAIKIPFSEASTETCRDGSVLSNQAWLGEMNLLFTESMDSFPMADYDDLAYFSSDSNSGTWDAIKNTAHAVEVLARTGWSVFTARNYGLLYKEYYSQVPYALGCDLAMKYRIIPKKNSCNAGKDDAKGSKGVRAHLSKCEAVYQLQVQTKSMSKDWDIINTQAHSRWREDYVAVAEFVFPRQTISDDGTATSEELRSVLTSRLSLLPTESTAVHKLFEFHPISTTDTHRPLGEINSFRSHFYARHATSRHQTIIAKEFAETNQQLPFMVPTDVWTGTSSVDGMDKLKPLFGL